MSASNREWITDPSYLPSLDEVKSVLGSEEGAEAIHDYYCSGPGPERFEIWTDEYISGLAEHVAEVLANSRGKVLEVGAGDGRLSGLLRRKFDEAGREISVIATDLDPPEDPHFPIEKADYKHALQDHAPGLVLSSWMPVFEEWTWAMRATPSVQEYVVIGVPPMTGNRSTWMGYPSPEIGEFAPVHLHDLDSLKVGQFSDYDIPRRTITRGFHRVTDAEVPVAD